MIEVIEVEYSLTHEIDYKHPTKFYIRNCLGNLVYFRTGDRVKAQLKCDEIYGIGHYKIIPTSVSKNTKELSCTGTATRKK